MSDTSKEALRLLNERICGKINDGGTVFANDVAEILEAIKALTAENDRLKARVAELEGVLRTIYPAPITPKQAAKVLLGDDITISRMAKAMHDRPLMCDEYEYRADTEAGRFCVEMAHTALRAIAEGESE